MNICAALAQNHKKNIIIGEVIGGNKDNDSIYFKIASIDPKYFEKKQIVSEITDSKFHIDNEVNYPQMYRIIFLSDKGKRVWREGKYFIDPSTTSIKIDYLSPECNQVDGRTAAEFSTELIPFFFKNTSYNCKSSNFQDLSRSRNSKFDSTLYNYVLKKPDSYVALWSLIERFSLFGQSDIRQKTLSLFSKKMKNTHVWNLLNNDFENSLIKEYEKFPDIDLKTNALSQVKLNTYKAKFTLIDFWFSRCKPCLKDIQDLKILYEKYKSKGFEIVGISTDKNEDIDLWQNRIIEYKIPWMQYLDENGIEASKLSISYFPTVFLLDNKGRVIKKDITLVDLDLFLKEHLSN